MTMKAVVLIMKLYSYRLVLIFHLSWLRDFLPKSSQDNTRRIRVLQIIYDILLAYITPTPCVGKWLTEHKSVK
jgi:hypothetical protein